MAEETASTPAGVATDDYCDSESFVHEACGHRFTFHPAGEARLSALIELIDEAQSTLEVFYYMFQDDESGHKVRDALVEAARRGVDVALVIDAFGSDAEPAFFEPIVEAGGSFAMFSADWNVRYLIRNHQKFAIADREKVFTGGSNVSNHYFDPPSRNGWCDLGVLIEGEVVAKFAEWFALIDEWAKSDGSQFRRIRTIIRNWDSGDGPVRLLMGGPLLRNSHWAYQFKKDVYASPRLDSVTAYFGPPPSFRRAIAKLARRGRARMIYAGKSDLDGTIYVARLYYRKLMRAGARILEFQPCKLHMKLLVLDKVSYFGSANLDRRSIRINIELMVRVEDEALAERLREFIDHLETASIEVDEKWYREHSTFAHRMRWRLFNWISLLDYGAARVASE